MDNYVDYAPAMPIAHPLGGPQTFYETILETICLLGVITFAVARSRLPWKKSDIASSFPDVIVLFYPHICQLGLTIQLVSQCLKIY